MAFDFKQYPKVMRHPAYRAAVLAKWDPKKPTSEQPKGEPVRFPPVTVHNKDQEIEYASKGYMPQGFSDQAAYMNAISGAAVPTDHQHHDYPAWRYKYKGGKDGPVMESVIVDSPEQDAAETADWFRTPDDAKFAFDEPLKYVENKESKAAAHKAIEDAKAEQDARYEAMIKAEYERIKAREDADKAKGVVQANSQFDVADTKRKRA